MNEEPAGEDKLEYPDTSQFVNFDNVDSRTVDTNDAQTWNEQAANDEEVGD